MANEVTQEDCDCMNSILRVIASSQKGDNIREAGNDQIADIISSKIAHYRPAAYDQGFADAKRAQRGYMFISRSADK